MKQILQNLASGETMLADVPAALVRRGCVLVQSEVSLVSLGTEKMLVDFGKASLLAKARQQPEKVKQVLQKIRTDGLGPTLEVVRARLDQPLALGYCNVGTVCEVGQGVEGLSVGDRVLSNGAHAETVCIPRNLCVPVPDGVSSEDAVFGVVASIGLQGIRLLEPTLGECFVVTGLGLIGLLAAQCLQAHGCRVLGVDLDSDKVELARSLGLEAVAAASSEEVTSAAEAFSRGQGVDGVLITASTKSSEPINQAAEICRKRGRIVQVGATGLQVDRTPFYLKELSFQVSCSYGPGRYDEDYEERGHDYPLPFVRWTEQRNFDAVLGLMAEGKLRPGPLITHRYSFDDALKAYETVSSGDALGIVLQYPKSSGVGEDEKRVVSLSGESGRPDAAGQAVCGVIGAGNFSSLVLLPALKAAGGDLHTLVSMNGVTAAHNGKKFGFRQAASDAEEVFQNGEINTVLITTRHGSHADYVLKGLRTGKRVFVEKPLCLHHDELQEIEAAYAAAEKPFLMVGFNRRFSPYVERMKTLLGASTTPMSIEYMVNAGPVPPDHWMHDREAGGGRILGEACHFIDLCRFLAGRVIEEASISYLGGPAGAKGDIASIQMSFQGGSIATVHYWANGPKSFPKERVEVFSAGRVLQLNNFRDLRGYGWSNFKKMKAGSQDKGHKEEVRRFVAAVEAGEEAPIPAEELFEVSRVSIDLAAQL
jgi:predicted dehydrogenase/threonine dehydrogenase-like Zn-dependent dehydrogenase